MEKIDESQQQSAVLPHMMFLLSELKKAKKKIKELKFKLATNELDLTMLKKENMYLAVKAKKLENDVEMQRDITASNLYIDNPVYEKQTSNNTSNNISNHISNSVLKNQKQSLRQVITDCVIKPRVSGYSGSITKSTIMKRRDSLKKVDKTQPVNNSKDEEQEEKTDYDYLFNRIKSRNQDHTILTSLNESLVESWIE